MPNYTSNLRLAQPSIGETGWADLVNIGITQLIEDSLTGISPINLQDSDYTLSLANGAQDESRKMFVDVSGNVTAIRNVIFPAVKKLFIAKNNCALPIVFKTASGSGVQLPPQASAILRCDGANVSHAISTFANQSYVHNQAAASAVWTISHNMNKYPSVTITDSANDEVEGEIRYDSVNVLTVKFSAPFAGKAYLN